jgi:tRNA threonylcarbamoyladenosine biosynthesis protein TsaE
MTIVLCPSPEATHAAGVALGQRLFPGAFVALVGDLGAGKTAFTKGIGEGLGVISRIQSPTYVLVQAHEGGRVPLWHADWYRLGEAGELDAIGFFDLLEQGAVVVEWADRFPEALPDDRLEVRMEIRGHERSLHIAATGPRHAPLEQI